MSKELMGHRMSENSEHCVDCGESRHKIVVQGLACKVEAEDDHAAEEKIEMERDN